MSSTIPAVFIGHGSPMNAIEPNRYTEAWRAFGATIPVPRAILAISAHWYINATAVTAQPDPKTIHDFYGFPPELFAVQYPAPGSPEIAQEIVDTLAPVWTGLDHDSWGIDHGTWSVLVHMFPEANIPVLQLSIDATKSFEEHLRIGAALAPLREKGILIFGSGNIVHNLRAIEWGKDGYGAPYAHAFDDDVHAIMTTKPGDLPGIVAHPSYSQAVPTPDHFIPSLYIAGVASASNTTASALVRGYEYGSLSMTSYVVN
jgi:4,5-DOPA dioxygenase extradiol